MAKVLAVIPTLKHDLMKPLNSIMNQTVEVSARAYRKVGIKKAFTYLFLGAEEN